MLLNNVKKHEEKLSSLIHYSCFVASGSSTWVAWVRGSAGFQTNKMLLSLRKEAKKEVVCIRACVVDFGQEGYEAAQTHAWRHKEKKEEYSQRKEVGMESHTTDSALLLRGTLRACKAMHICMMQNLTHTHSSDCKCNTYLSGFLSIPYLATEQTLSDTGKQSCQAKYPPRLKQKQTLTHDKSQKNSDLINSCFP